MIKRIKGAYYSWLAKKESDVPKYLGGKTNV
jgi:hypothetical protein